MDRNRGFDISALRQQMEDLLEDFLQPGGRKQPGGRGPGGDQQQQHLTVNVVDQEDRIVVSAPLPGMGPEDIDITVRGQSLSLRAQQKSPPTERPQYTRREWGYGPFQRTVELSAPVDADRAEASFRGGVVTITLPKSDLTKARVIKLDDAEAEATPPAEPSPVSEIPAQEVPVEVSAPITDVAPAAEAAPGQEAVTAEGEAEQPTSFYMRPPRGRGRQPRGPRAGRSSAKNAPSPEGSASEPEGKAGEAAPPSNPEEA